MRIAHITDGMTSSVNADLELSRRLREAGHEVLFLSPADVGEAIRAENLAFHPLSADRSFLHESPTLSWSDARDPKQFVASIRARRDVRRASLANDEVERTIATIAPDVLLLDFEMHHARIVTANLGIPTLMTSVFFSVFRQPGLPPLDSTTRPDETDQGQLDREWRKAQALTRGLEWRQRAIRSATADWFRPIRYQSMDIDSLRELAETRGLDLSVMADRSNWQRPFTHNDLPFLSFNLAEMELPHQRPPNVHYVGPMVSLDRLETAVGEADRRRWDTFRAARTEGRPLVYCSLGSYWSADLGMLERIVEVFRHRPDWDLVVGLGGITDPASLGVLPVNVLALSYAPQVDVLKEASCAITHGGATSVAECVMLEVPMIVYSTGQVDQNGNAVRVEVSELGIVGAATDRPADIEDNVKQVITDPAFSARLASMRQLADDRRMKAVRVIESQVANELGSSLS